jgi:hypothetical protein
MEIATIVQLYIAITRLDSLVLQSITRVEVYVQKEFDRLASS